MKKIPIKDIVDGMVLKRDIRSAKGQLLFTSGCALNSSHIEQLSRYKVQEIFVDGRDIPSELELFDNAALQRLERQIESRFKDSLDSEVMEESLRIAKKIILERALRNGQILTKSQLNLIARLKDLPTLPQIYVRLIQAINDPRATSQKISQLISADPVMSAKILKLVNSSFYNFPQKITSLANAVSLLGYNTITNLVFSSAVFGIFKHDQKTAADIIGKVWEHCLATAIISRLITKRMEIKDNDDNFTAGLLHDIGQIVIAYFFIEDFKVVWEKLEGGSREPNETENECLGYTHVDAGRILAEKWNLPDMIVEVINCHHQPYNAKLFPQQTAIVHAADVFATALNYGEINSRVPRLDNEAWSLLKIKLEDIEPILNASERDFEESRAIFFLQATDMPQVKTHDKPYSRRSQIQNYRR